MAFLKVQVLLCLVSRMEAGIGHPNILFLFIDHVERLFKKNSHLFFVEKTVPC